MKKRYLYRYQVWDVQTKFGWERRAYRIDDWGSYHRQKPPVRLAAKLVGYCMAKSAFEATLAEEKKETTSG